MKTLRVSQHMTRLLPLAFALIAATVAGISGTVSSVQSHAADESTYYDAAGNPTPDDGTIGVRYEVYDADGNYLARHYDFRVPSTMSNGSITASVARDDIDTAIPFDLSGKGLYVMTSRAKANGGYDVTKNARLDTQNKTITIDGNYSPREITATIRLKEGSPWVKDAIDDGSGSDDATEDATASTASVMEAVKKTTGKDNAIASFTSLFKAVTPMAASLNVPASVTITVDSNAWDIHYGRNNTILRKAQDTGNIAICVDPSVLGLAPGDSKTYTNIYDVTRHARSSELRTLMYFGFGGPKYDENDPMWYNNDDPGSDHFGNYTASQLIFLYTHILVADTFKTNFDAATHGMNDDQVNWIAYRILGNDKNGNIINQNALRFKIQTKANEVPGEDQFIVYVVNTTDGTTGADGKQPYITYQYRELQKNPGQVIKTSANPDITANNPYYSFKGAKFGLYQTEADAKAFANPLDELRIENDGDSTSTASSPHVPGTYYVRETQAPTGYKLNPNVFPITITENGTAQVTIPDEPVLVPIKAVKIDADTKKVVAKAGFTFRLLGSDGKTPYKTSDGKSDYTTDATGTVTFPKLPLGIYYIQEIATQGAYELNNTPIKVEITTASSEDPDPVEVQVPNKPAKVGVSLVKKDSESGTPVKGAHFRLYSKGTVTVGGTKKYDANQDLSKLLNNDQPYETDANGTISVSDLYIDDSGTSTFYFKEVAPAPDGYVIDTTKTYEVTVSLKNASGSTDAKATPVQVTNTPNGIELTKTLDDGSGADPQKLAGATFWLWKKSDEVHVDPEDGRDSYVLRITGSTGDEKVTVQQVMGYAEVAVAENDKGYSLSLRDSKGNEYQVTTGTPAKVPEDVYDVTVRDKDGNAVEATGKTKLTTKNGSKAAYTVKDGTDGKTVLSVEQGQVDDSVLDASYDVKTDTFSTAKLNPNTLYDILVDGNSVYRFTTDDAAGKTYYGRYDASAKGYNYKRQPMLLTYDNKVITSFPINGKSYTVPQKTDDNGKIVIERIPAGEYGFGEMDVPNTKDDDSSKAPLISTEVTYITVGTDGKVNSQTRLNVSANNVETHVTISKNEITGGPEIPGAHLEIHDSNDNVVEEWTSTDTPHDITGLTPGKYTLIETLTPNNYDQATRVEFWVYDTDKIQKVEMHDQPLHINALIDKRQEIADPVAENTEPNGDGKNKADVTQSNEGKYLYSLDYKNDSNTWVDEFTVYDPLDGVNQEYVRLNALTTAQAYEDFDGKLNVWYQTNKTPSDYADDQYKANATKDDGHDNAWLTNPNDDIKSRDTDGDGRILSYVGWKLWKKDVDATQATTLNVSDLGLADGEYVTGIRLEYGRVEEGFTTRPDGWDRADLKDEHDDMKPVEQFHEGTFKVEGLKAVLSRIGTIETYLNDYLNVLYPSDGADAANGNANVNGASTAAENANGNDNDAAAVDSDRAKVEKAIGTIRNRISEGANSSDEKAIREALADLETAVEGVTSQVLSEENVTDAKSLDQAAETFQQAYGRVKALLPADVTASADAAINAAKSAAAGTASSDDVEKARQGLEDAVTPILDALTADAASAGDVHYAATILDMQLTDKYVPGMNLDNSAHVDAYRNGGGEGLEGHDNDKVTQTPKASDLASDILAQTGDGTGIAVAIAGTMTAVASGSVLMRKRAA